MKIRTQHPTRIFFAPFLLSFAFPTTTTLRTTLRTTLQPPPSPSLLLAMTAKRISNDIRIPTEVWERIFSYLYPSQLSRLSIVSKAFYSIVASLPVWTRLFALAHPNMELRLLRGRSASNSCFLYMCAISLHFCESCQKLTPFQQDNPFKLPLPVLVTLPSNSVLTTSITSRRGGDRYIAGNMVNYNWRIRKCVGCRDKTSTAVVPELSPVWESTLNMNDKDYYAQWQEVYPQLHLARFQVHYADQLPRSFVMEHLNNCLGGPVGVEAAKKPTRDYDSKTWKRIVWYQIQD